MGNSAQIIEEMLAARGWTAYELAQNTGLDQATISKVRAGKRDISYNRLSNALEQAGFQLKLVPHPRQATLQRKTSTEITPQCETHSDPSLSDGEVPETLLELPYCCNLPDSSGVDNGSLVSQSDSSGVDNGSLVSQSDSDPSVMQTAASKSHGNPRDLLHRLFAIMHYPPNEHDIEDGSLWNQLKTPIWLLGEQYVQRDERIGFLRALYRVEDTRWRAFLAGLYVYLGWTDDPMHTDRPGWEQSQTTCRLKTMWTPLPTHSFEPVPELSDWLSGNATRRPTREPSVWLPKQQLRIPKWTLIPGFLQFNVLIPRNQLP